MPLQKGLAAIAPLPVIFGLLAAITTWCGGQFALRWRHQLHWLLCFSAGAVLGVALFDLLPETLELTGPHAVSTAVAAVAVGVLVYAAVHRFHSHRTDHSSDHAHPTAAQSLRASTLAAGSLALHSLLDGAGIGLAYKVSPSVGIIASIGVLVHDFSDGINTVGVVLRSGHNDVLANRWLLVDSIAPIIGVLVTSFITPSKSVMGMLLGLFCGFFLYIASFDLLPEGARRCSRPAALLFTSLGAATLFVAVRLARL